MVIIFQQKQLQNSDINLRHRRKLTCIPASHMKQINNISTNSQFFFARYTIVAKYQKLVPIMIYFCKQELLGAEKSVG